LTRRVAAGAALALACAVPAWSGSKTSLIYHVEAADGTVLRSHGSDRLFNPASVVKVGTSLWALERLGCDHRYVTELGYRGEWDRDRGVITGALVVRGGGDPDLQAENVYLIARALNTLGVHRVDGSLEVVGDLWVGWENGVAKRIENPQQRAGLMARRLLQSFDSARWDTTARACWEGMCRRRPGLDVGAPPRIEITGDGAWVEQTGKGYQPLVRHSSNPLPELLKRFNVYSNNDLIRVADRLGGVAALQAYLGGRLGPRSGPIELETASGENRNRMTARGVVQLLRQLGVECEKQSLDVRELLPVLGCDPGPTRRMFPRLSAGELAATVTCKTGTLATTDGGVAVLAGFVETAEHGQVLFCVAAPGAGQRLRYWRRIEQDWLVSLIAELGGATPGPCGPELSYSDTGARVEIVTVE
jgi:D-alanyl-D-alanine carboxypeptidase/D-alanyl-D-alanine-endopeptidase (penicillin-binding protein 4)